MVAKALAACVLVMLACAACIEPGPASPSRSATPAKPVITASTASELGAVLEAQYRALAGKDLKAFQATVDLTRPAFRRCAQEYFDIAARQGSVALATKVVKVEPYGDSYVRAYVLDPGGAGVARIYFKRDGERWILTEPKIEDLGGERTRTFDGVRVEYWGIDDDIVDMVGREATATRDYVKTVAVRPIKDPYYVKLIPTRETAGIVACQFSAFANSRDEHAPFIGFWKMFLAPELDRVSDYQRAIFRHEGLHYVQDQFIHGILIRLDWWLVEGWPDYVAQSGSAGSKRIALCGDGVPTMKRLVDGVPTEPDTPPELSSQYYALANSMIDYVYATYGAQTYWDLISLYVDNTDYRVNYPKIFKVEPDVFYSSWLAFAKKKYC